MLTRASSPILVALVLLGFTLVGPSPARAGQTTSTVAVVGNVYWNDTGIDVPAGATVAIAATGTIFIAGSDPGRGPEGIPGCVEAFTTSPAPGLTCVALVGRIGDGPVFEVGTGTTLTAASGGRLFLTINDSFHGDNRGSWTATVAVTTPPAEPTDKAQCKKGGWRAFAGAAGAPRFANQGDCVSFVERHAPATGAG